MTCFGDSTETSPLGRRLHANFATSSCPSCGHRIRFQDQRVNHHNNTNHGGLPAGVKFDPSDHELLEHLEGKSRPETQKLHPLIDDFITTIDGEDGICYTHPEKLPGVSRDGLIRHFFHRPSKAYTTGTRKRRKVHTGGDEDGGGAGETRWHKTGKTRPVFSGGIGRLLGHKKILVLYTNYGKQRKPEKTNWVMHQYHLGPDEEEKEGELVVSKVFYQTQPRQCGGGGRTSGASVGLMIGDREDDTNLKEGKSNFSGFYGSSCVINYGDGREGHENTRRSSPPPPLQNFVAHDAQGPFFNG